MNWAAWPNGAPGAILALIVFILAVVFLVTGSFDLYKAGMLIAALAVSRLC